MYKQGWNGDGNKFWRDRWDGIEVLREWVGMEVKVDGDGWNGDVKYAGIGGEMGVISDPMQISSL